MGFGSGMTCWRRLRDWNEAGVWQRLHEALLAGLDVASRLDWSRRVVDSSHVRALKEGIHTGPSPVDRGRAGSKHHLITDGARHSARGHPHRRQPQRRYPAAAATRRHPASPGRVGRPRRKPDSLFADRGYDHDIHRDKVRARRTLPVIARRGTPPRQRTGCLPLGGRAHVRLAARLPTSPGALGKAGRHPQGAPQTRLLPHHPPATQLILLAVVSQHATNYDSGFNLGTSECHRL
jgi:hypothetical protein